MKLHPVVLLAVGALMVTGCGSGASSDNAEPADWAETTTAADTPSLKSAELAVDAPATIYRSRVTLKGTASRGASVTVDGRQAAVNSDGNWTRSVTAKPGENSYLVAVELDGHETAEEVVEVTRKRTQQEIARVVAERKAREAAREAEREARIAARVANWKASAQAIPYNQLKKSPDRYAGDRVKFTGQIFQIQEDGDSGGMMLLAVTDEGYGFWTDNVWVNYDRSIRSAEDDIVTVYGVIDGARSYETQIGGETYVPEMTARYIEE